MALNDCCAIDGCVHECHYYFSYFLYSISHPGKEGVPLIDLSKDDECQYIQDQNLTSNQIAIERVIIKTFCKYGITAATSEKIRFVFRGKLWRMCQNLSKLGGTKHVQLLNDWKETVWSLTIPGVASEASPGRAIR